jgi:hypothetical protein
VPSIHIEPHELPAEDLEELRRADPPTAPLDKRTSSFAEVELTLAETDARNEACRCLRCDLDFTRPAELAVARSSGGQA